MRGEDRSGEGRGGEGRIRGVSLLIMGIAPSEGRALEEEYVASRGAAGDRSGEWGPHRPTLTHYAMMDRSAAAGYIKDSRRLEL